MSDAMNTDKGEGSNKRARPLFAAVSASSSAASSSTTTTTTTTTTTSSSRDAAVDEVIRRGRERIHDPRHPHCISPTYIDNMKVATHPEIEQKWKTDNADLVAKGVTFKQHLVDEQEKKQREILHKHIAWLEVRDRQEAVANASRRAIVVGASSKK